MNLLLLLKLLAISKMQPSVSIRQELEAILCSTSFPSHKPKGALRYYRTIHVLYTVATTNTVQVKKVAKGLSTTVV